VGFWSKVKVWLGRVTDFLLMGRQVNLWDKPPGVPMDNPPSHTLFIEKKKAEQIKRSQPLQ